MKAGLSLFDVLAGRCSELSREEDRMECSIISNLECLFNTRREFLAHLPGFGVPSVTELYRNSTEAVEEMRQAIEEAVRAYEPRLIPKTVKVRHEENTGSFDMRLVFVLSGQLRGSQKTKYFQTTFSSVADRSRGGGVRVEPRR